MCSVLNQPEKEINPTEKDSRTLAGAKFILLHYTIDGVAALSYPPAF